jgi:hypothetical protein
MVGEKYAPMLIMRFAKHLKMNVKDFREAPALLNLGFVVSEVQRYSSELI